MFNPGCGLTEQESLAIELAVLRTRAKALQFNPLKPDPYAVSPERWHKKSRLSI